MKKFDVIVLGSGPGGYIAAIRASQLGKQVALVEKERLGGVCLNKGCIPTKALLKSAHSVHQLKEMEGLGIDLTINKLSADTAVERAQGIAGRISKGVEYLMKKNKIEVLKGHGEIVDEHTLAVGDQQFSFDNLIIATGAHYKTFPGLKHNGEKVIGAWEALQLRELPKKIAIIGAGAIGMEFAYFWNAFGVDVSIFELQERLLPLEDDDASSEVARAYKKYGIKLNLGLDKVTVSDDATISVTRNGDTKQEKFDLCLLAVGMTGNVEGIGLERVSIVPEKGRILVNEFYQTSVPHIYAIGDVNGHMQLAHVASHQGVIAAEKIAGKDPHPLNLLNVPACTYCQPQVASVGQRERDLKKEGISYKVAKLPFKANGKAVASNESSGFVKVLMGDDGELLGAHIVGEQATELIGEYTLFKSMEGIDDEILSTVHAHPTLGEWLHEAVLSANGTGLNS